MGAEGLEQGLKTAAKAGVCEIGGAEGGPMTFKSDAVEAMRRGFESLQQWVSMTGKNGDDLVQLRRLIRRVEKDE